jgi:hypothetical protein
MAKDLASIVVVALCLFTVLAVASCAPAAPGVPASFGCAPSPFEPNRDGHAGRLSVSR